MADHNTRTIITASYQDLVRHSAFQIDSLSCMDRCINLCPFFLYSVSKLDTFENEINYAYKMMNTVFVSACRQNKFRNIVTSEEFGVETDTTFLTFCTFSRFKQDIQNGR
jgi:hypothetical protein